MRSTRHITIGVITAVLSAGVVFVAGFRPTSTPSDVQLSVTLGEESHDDHSHDHDGHPHDASPVNVPTSTAAPDTTPDNWVQPASLSGSLISSETSHELTHDGSWQFQHDATFNITEAQIDNVIADLEAEGMTVTVLNPDTRSAMFIGGGFSGVLSWDADTQTLTISQAQRQNS